MKVRAPFHVGEDYGGDWILYALRLELIWIDRADWIYCRVQRLQSQADRLGLMARLSRWRRSPRARKLAKTYGTSSGTQIGGSFERS